MRNLRAALALLLALPAFSETKTFPSFDKRSVEVTAPVGWTMSSQVDPQVGARTVRLRNSAVVLDVTFYPDADNRFATEQAMESLMRASFAHLLEGATQKEMSLTFAETAGGMMGYTVFTDAKWVGKEIPKNEWRHATAGVRRWPGAFVHFTVLSNDLDSADYRQALEVVKSGMREP